MAETSRAQPSATASRPHILLGHGGPILAGAAQRILDAYGFEVEVAPNSASVETALSSDAFDALVVDVALPGAPGFELTGMARAAGVKVVILVASVFRRTSYKRRPRRLYGADDYVEIHHLGDHLPQRLRAHLGLDDMPLADETLREVLRTIDERGDSRLREQSPRGLAQLIVSDLLLYNGDRITEAESVDDALTAVATDLDGARDLFEQVRPNAEGGDLIGQIFRELVSSLDGRGEAT